MNKHEKLNHPFITRLNASLRLREEAQAAGNTNRTQRVEGNKGDRHIIHAYTRINRATLKEILGGNYIPTETQIAGILEDMGMRPGAEDYNALYTLGQQYIEANQPTKKPVTPKIFTPKPKGTFNTKTLKAEDIYFPSQPVDLVVHEILRMRNRLKEFEYRYYEKALDNIPNPPDVRSNIASAVTRANDRGLVAVRRHARHTPESLQKISDYLQCTPEENAALHAALAQQEADLLERPKMDAFCETLKIWRLKRELLTLMACSDVGLRTDAYERIEKNVITPKLMHKMLTHLGYATVDDFVHYVSQLPDSPSSRAGYLLKNGYTPVTNIEPELEKLDAYLKKLLINPTDFAEKIGVRKDVLLSCSRGRSANEETFSRVLTNLGFENREHFAQVADDFLAGRTTLQDQPEKLRAESPLRLINESKKGNSAGR